MQCRREKLQSAHVTQLWVSKLVDRIKVKAASTEWNWTYGWWWWRLDLIIVANISAPLSFLRFLGWTQNKYGCPPGNSRNKETCSIWRLANKNKRPVSRITVRVILIFIALGILFDTTTAIQTHCIRLLVWLAKCFLATFIITIWEYSTSLQHLVFLLPLPFQCEIGKLVRITRKAVYVRLC